MDYLQVLSIGGNNVEGEILAYAFENKTELQQLDISDNKSSGPLPNLTCMSKYLNYLDVSGNQFEGPLPDLTSFESLRYVNLGRNKFEGTACLTSSICRIQMYHLLLLTCLTIIYRVLSHPGIPQTLAIFKNSYKGIHIVITMTLVMMVSDATALKSAL